MKKIFIIVVVLSISAARAASLYMPMGGWGSTQFNASSAYISSSSATNQYCTISVKAQTTACADSNTYYYQNVYCGNTPGVISFGVDNNYCGTAKNAWLGTSVPYIQGISPGDFYNHSGSCNISLAIGYGGSAFSTTTHYSDWGSISVSGMTKGQLGPGSITFARSSKNCIEDLTTMGVTWGLATGVNVSTNLQHSPSNPTMWSFCVSVDGQSINCNSVSGGNVTPPDPIFCSLGGDNAIDFGVVSPEDVDGLSDIAHLTLSCTGVGRVSVSIISGSSTNTSGVKHTLSDSLSAFICLVPASSTSCNSTPGVINFTTSTTDINFGVKALLSGNSSAGDYSTSVVILSQQY